ncbi:hypothetical protein BC832DRAFT_595359 [Gaertneriomyces semiglobifer]|nr:hypothetical protein BC832DRAFT_595359 [Gaertneriomyces semiglobifer]
MTTGNELGALAVDQAGFLDRVNAGIILSDAAQWTGFRTICSMMWMVFLKAVNKVPNLPTSLQRHAAECVTYFKAKKAVFLTAYSKRRLQILDEDILQETRTKVINQGRQVGYQAVQQGIAEVENDLNVGHEAEGQETQDPIEPCTPPRKRRKSEGHIEIRNGSVSYHISDVPFDMATPKKPKLRQQDIAALKDVVAIGLSNVPSALGAPSILGQKVRANQEEQRTLGSLKRFPEALKLLQGALKQQDIEKWPQWLWSYQIGETASKDDMCFSRVLLYTMTEFHRKATALRPQNTTRKSNERTTWIRYVVPLFETLATCTGLVQFMWGGIPNDE